MTFEEKYNLVPTEFKTASQIGLAAATLGAMVRRGLVEATNTSPKQYRKSSNPAAKLYILIEQNKDDFDTYFIDRAKAIMKVIEGAMEKTISDKGSEQTINSYGVSLED